MTSILLSKSKYLNGLQCLKLLWLEINNPESDCKPDETLTDILRKAGTFKYNKTTHAKMISRELDTEILKTKSENFRDFIDLIRLHY